ncbi:chymotrypsin-like elastase family member 2A [Oppia nitens]|uniref:chymotrypsin-like elastase family member 2A n=1 Tax=Oppia nitens TaxID=1686743 RepID=UPI0023DB1038|nr:chymotrypsin-like elastase family member 2A [Oppia nitens]
MINLKLSFLLLAVTTVESLWAYQCGNSTIKRIADGEDVERKAWPWMTAIYVDYINENGQLVHDFSCGGSLISDEWVLTAAHCVVKKNHQNYGNIELRFGEHKRSEEKNLDRRIRYTYDKNIIVHHDYDYAQYPSNDIALIKLGEPLRLDDRDNHLQPICLPQAVNGQYANDDNCTLTGWGMTRFTKSSDILQELAVEMLPADTCKKYYSNYDENIKICVSNGVNSKVAGRGDSGSPLNCQLSTRQWVVEGIASYVSNYLPINRKPDVYVNVLPFVQWIKDKTGIK